MELAESTIALTVYNAAVELTRKEIPPSIPVIQDYLDKTYGFKFTFQEIGTAAIQLLQRFPKRVAVSINARGDGPAQVMVGEKAELVRVRRRRGDGWKGWIDVNGRKFEEAP